MVKRFYFCAHSSNHSWNENVLVVNWQRFFSWTFQWLMPGLLHFLVRSYQSQLSSLFTFIKKMWILNCYSFFFPLFLKRDQTRYKFIMKINKHDSWLCHYSWLTFVRKWSKYEFWILPKIKLTMSTLIWYIIHSFEIIVFLRKYTIIKSLWLP